MTREIPQKLIVLSQSLLDREITFFDGPFPMETISAISHLEIVLRGIHKRMRAEGFRIKDGKIIKDEE